MDGGALVTMAEQWTNVPPQKICRAREDSKPRQVLFLFKLYQIKIIKKNVYIDPIDVRFRNFCGILLKP